MEAKGKGYAYWAKNFNSKQYAKSILFLTENHLSIDDLPRATEEACTKADALTAELKKAEAQIASTLRLIEQVRVYLSTVSSYKKYKASGWSRAFFAEHESEVRRYKQALLTFDEAGYQTVPKLKALYDALGQLKSQRQELIGEYAAAKKTKQELLTVQANLNALLPQDKKSAPIPTPSVRNSSVRRMRCPSRRDGSKGDWGNFFPSTKHVCLYTNTACHDYASNTNGQLSCHFIFHPGKSRQ